MVNKNHGIKTRTKNSNIRHNKIISEFTFLFWLDNFEHINDKRIQYGETFHEQIENLCDELKNIWDSEYYLQHFESTLKVCSDSIKYIEGLQNYVKLKTKDKQVLHHLACQEV